MKISRLINAVVKSGGTVTYEQNAYRIKKNGKYTSMSFWTNGDSDEVCYVTLHDPQTDAMTDLFMDTYFRTIKQVVRQLQETP